MENRQRLAKKVAITYSDDVDILCADTGKQVDISYDVGDFVIDFDKQKNVVGLEIFNAEEHFAYPAHELLRIKQGTLAVRQENGVIYIALRLGKERIVTIPFQIRK